MKTKEKIEELTKEYGEDKIEELTEEHGEDAIRAYIDVIKKEYLDNFDNFEEAYQGEWESDEDFVRDLLEGTGDIPKDLPFYIHIDWKTTTRDIMMDYTEENGFYFRDL